MNTMAQFEYSEWLARFLNRTVFYFDWDDGNDSKSLKKHNVTISESEYVFYDEDLSVLGVQKLPATVEMRFGVVGKTLDAKILFICFTLRDSKIRIISSRSANQKEKEIYENQKIR